MSATTAGPPPPPLPPPGRLGTTDLLRRYARGGDRRDLEALTERFRPLARRLALTYARGGVPADDLEQVANVGLVKALQRFDPDRGFAFASYAVPTIVGELKRSFRVSAWAVHVPRALQERAASVRECRDALEATHGRPATVAQLARELEASQEDVLEALAVAGTQHALSLDAPGREEEDEELALGDGLGGLDEGYERAEDLAAIEQALRALPPTQRLVLRLRFQEDLLQSEIADVVGVSQMQVSRLLRAGLERLQVIVAHRSRAPVAEAA